MKTDGRQYSTVSYLKGFVTKPDQSSATKMCARDLKDRSHWKQTVKADRGSWVLKLRSLKNRKQKDLNRKDRQELNTDANIHICKHRGKDYHSRIGCAATDDAAPLHLSITLKLIAFFSIK